MVTGIIIVNILLAVICTIFMVKNFLISNNLSDKGLKNIALAALGVIALFCALNGVWQGNIVNQYIDQAQIYKNMDGNQIAEMIEAGKRSILKSTIIGYLSLIISFIVYRNIKKEIEKKLEKHKDKWDLQ